MLSNDAAVKKFLKIKWFANCKSRKTYNMSTVAPETSRYLAETNVPT
jgi:hypothetical protein